MLRSNLLALLFSTAAFAMPAPDATGIDLDSLDSAIENVPSSIAAVLATAVPTAWAMSLATDAAFASSVMAAEAAGTMPAWYSDLPNSVKEYYSTAADAALGLTDTATTADATATATAGSSSGSAASGTTATATDAATTATDAATSSSGSSSASGSAQASSTSTGGAAVATGGLVMSVAGAAGILGLAFAL